MIFKYLFIGVVSGLIVASWHSFKDPPWEGFFPLRFMRSLISGGVIASLLLLLKNLGYVRVDNLGIIGLSTVCLERIWGEVLKGFIKKKEHKEYLPVFNKWSIPYKNYSAKLILGTLFTLIVTFLMLSFLKLPYTLETIVNNKIVLGAICGFVGGLTVSIGGSIKDAPAEGFKPLKFIRSPIAGIIGGILIISFIKSYDLLIIGVIGFERIVVEFYKTFYTKSKRGIFDGMEVKYPDWFKKRWIFFLSYSSGVFIVFMSLIFNIS